jgi:hypothetical protein
MPKIGSRNRDADIIYNVVWNSERRAFDVQRDGLRLGSFARDKSTAVGLAIREAKLEATGSIQKIIVVSHQDGRRVVEWDGR